MRFKTAIIDPPWPYAKITGCRKMRGFVSQDDNEIYPVLSVADLQELPIDAIMDPNEAYLFIWAATGFLPEAIKLIEAWNFKYVTNLCWYKDNSYGVGYWFRGNHELALVAKRKRAASIRTNTGSVFEDDHNDIFDWSTGSAFRRPRTRHSQKPSFLHEIIERKNADGTTHFPEPFLEIFARQSRQGWTVLGNEAPGDGKDIRESLADLLDADAVSISKI